MPEFKYFDTEELYEKAEREAVGDVADCIITYETTGFSHRWIQPPVACYFVTSLDEHGNIDMAPITMGSAMWGEPPNGYWYFGFDVQNSRQTQKNISLNKECVISYYSYKLFKESWIAGLPLPKGISEIDVAGLTELPSKKVKPSGVQECFSNLECKIVAEVPISNSTLFVAKVVGVSVNKEALEADMKRDKEPGMVMEDLMYEVSITGEPPRMNFMRMDRDTIYSNEGDLGDDAKWLGTFESWMESEKRRGKVSDEEYRSIMALYANWSGNMDPAANAKTKQELTDALRHLVRR